MRRRRDKVDAGEYRNPVRIESLEDTTDELGGHPKVPTILYTGHAYIRPAYSYEREHNMQTQHEVTHVIRMRAVPIITATTCRLVLEHPLPERIFAIYSVLNVEERNRVVQMLCIEQPGKF
jgi:head-tail adaptor